MAGHLACGDYTGVDAATAKRIKRGDYPIRMTLDLHGIDRIEAYSALRESVEMAYHGNRRCVLVITGKGKQGEGVLRASLPQWLNDTPIRPFVLAYDVAAQKHGGQGAFYILIKRKRVKDDE